MPKHVTESVDSSITADVTFTTGACKVSPGGSFQADVIAEYTAATGVTVDGVLLKDSDVRCDVLYTDVIDEDTAAAGVTIDGVELKDFNVGATGVTSTTVNTTNIYTSTADITVLRFVKALTSDHTASGHIEEFVAGEDVVFGDVCYFKSDGKMWKGNAGVSTTMPVHAMSVEDITTANTGSLILNGWVRDDSWNWTPGVLLYMSSGSSGVTSTVPSTSGDMVQTIGWAYSADVIYFNPSTVLVEVA